MFELAQLRLHPKYNQLTSFNSLIYSFLLIPAVLILLLIVSNPTSRNLEVLGRMDTMNLSMGNSVMNGSTGKSLILCSNQKLLLNN